MTEVTLPSESGSNAPRVLRNASMLFAAQILVAPISVLVNAVAARKLGVATYGYFYQALTFASFVFLFVEWGQSSALMARVATDRGRAGELLGSSMGFRLGATLLALAVVPLACLFAGYNGEVVSVLALMLFGGLFGAVVGSCQDVFRGFERADFAVVSIVGWQLLSAMAVVPTLLLGGGLHAVILAQIACAAVGAAVVLWMLPRMGVSGIVFRWSTSKDLIRAGKPFFFFSLALAITPLVNAAMLAKFATPESMGWYAAALKLLGVLTFPAAALVGSLYPTLCRLHVENVDAFRSTTGEALYAVTLVAVPIALGCAFFPELGVSIFGLENYGPAEDNLRILAAYLLLVYFSMPIGSCLTACGRQSAWTILQFACVLVPLALDAPLISWFQQHTGNGSLGVCVATLIGEIVVIAGALLLLPKGVLAKIPRRKCWSALLAGAVMAAIALSSTALHVLVRAPLAILAYALVLQLSGGFNFLQLRGFMSFMRGR